MGRDRLAVVAMAMELAAARAGVAADPHALAPRHAVLESAADLGEESRLQPRVDEGVRVALDDPMVDAVAAAIFGDAHLVVAVPAVIAMARLDEDISAGFVDLDEPAAILRAQHIRHDEHR